ncbi:MAG: flagellar biosynthetic protein FliR [Candidatus Melainabacteria bacterium]|nr:flagellar biosynthetic protein FliR [Candidatus Melainabacteria bacterium]
MFEISNIIVNQAKLLQELGGIINVWFLVFTRSVAFASTAPLLSHRTIAAPIRITFSIILSLILMPLLEVPQEYPKEFEFVYLIVMNVLVGMLIGWVAQLILEIGRIAGEMLDMQMALNAATVFDPGNQVQSTIIGRFFEMIALIIFISMGGLEKVIEGFYKSYETFPVVIHQINFSFDKLLRISADVIIIGFLIISPIVIFLLAVDLILGIMSRAAPQINAFQISFSIKPAIALILLLILLPALFKIFVSLFTNPTRGLL